MSSGCVNHPGAPAPYRCGPCGTALCGSCVHLLRDGKTAECARCGSLVLPATASIGSAPARQRFEGPATDRSLIERLPDTVRWLGRRSVILVLAATAVFQWIFSFGLVLGIVSAGVTAALFFYIVERSADGNDDIDTPDFVDLAESVFAPFARFLATLVPLFVALWLGGLPFLAALAGRAGGWLDVDGVALVILLAWIALWPLLIVVAALGKSILAVFDPRVWWKTLLEMRADYAIAAAAFYAVLLVDSFVVRPLLFRLSLHAPVPFFVPVLVNYVLLNLLALRARVLGEACRPYL